MDELNELLRPTWGAEKWIQEGFSKITNEEKQLIKDRMQALFKEGLPFKLKHDKLLYIYTFSLLAQLEVLAIQIPLRFEAQMSTPTFRQQMRTQLLDEIFHGLVFTKIVYMLSLPYAAPPAYNEHIETLCNFIRSEECPKIGVVLLNLVAEGWIEEVFKSLKQAGVAPEVFETILADEHRHVCEADLYRDIGIPDQNILCQKLEKLEELLLMSLTLQPKYAMAIYVLLGISGARSFLLSLQDKHNTQLKKINLTPSRQWQSLMQLGEEALTHLKSPAEVEMTPVRQVFMTQWDSPGDPIMTGQFDMDISVLDFFAKKYPPETLTTLTLQSISHLLTLDDTYRHFISYKKLYRSHSSHVAIVVKLPDCGDHVGNIVFRNCHEMTVFELSRRIRQHLEEMVYCYQKREALEKEYPYLKQNLDGILYEYAYDEYDYPIAGNPAVSLSSIGFCGYSQAISPLRKQEGLKFTLLTVERKPVWNKKTGNFEPRDILPVSVSADHRVFDGNVPIPKLLSSSFQRMFKQMEQSDIKRVSLDTTPKHAEFIKVIETMLKENLELGYRALATLQNVWLDYIELKNIVNVVTKKLANHRLTELMNE